METSFFWFGVFSGSFGVRSIVLCKCLGKYIDIYFNLKITFSVDICDRLYGNNIYIIHLIILTISINLLLLFIYV